MEYIDDHPVVSYRVRFEGRAEIDETRSDLVRDELTVLWLVKAHCLPPQYHPVTRGEEERYRFNIQHVEAVCPLRGGLREQAIAYIDHGGDQTFLASGPNGFNTMLPFDHGLYEERDEAKAQLDELHEFLSGIGELHDGETVVDGVRRLLQRRPQYAPGILPCAETSDR